MSFIFNDKNPANIIIGSKSVASLSINSKVIWIKNTQDNWVLDENGYIIGDDGKYYQRYYDESSVIDNNPIVDLNSQWVVDRISTTSTNNNKNYDYYMSNSNYNVSNGYAQFKVSWSGLTNIKFLYRSYGEANYDYLVINGLDKPKFTSKPSYTTSGILAHTRATPSTSYKTLDIDCDSKEHFIWFCYLKDGSGNSNSDRAFVGVPNNLTSVRIKEGKELRYEYIISNDYIFEDGYIQYKYYKTYYTPNNSKSYTIKDDYILGEKVNATPITKNYLRFDATTNDVNISVLSTLFTDLEYSNGYEETWTPYTSNIELKQGQSVYFRAAGSQIASSHSSGKFIISGKVECHGNVNSLINKTTFESLKTIPNKTYYFYALFKDCPITTAPELPATTLRQDCYAGMFEGCKQLVTAPVLPATTLTAYCYSDMFEGCTSLVNAPALPATTLAKCCYCNMFNGCTSLVTAPVLPATTLAEQCYLYMFSGCKNLKEIYCNARYSSGTTEITTSISPNWLNSVPNTTDCIFHKNPDWAGPTSRGVDTIPSNWQIVDWVR